MRLRGGEIVAPEELSVGSRCVFSEPIAEFAAKAGISVASPAVRTGERRAQNCERQREGASTALQFKWQYRRAEFAARAGG